MSERVIYLDPQKIPEHLEQLDQIIKRKFTDDALDAVYAYSEWRQNLVPSSFIGMLETVVHNANQSTGRIDLDDLEKQFKQSQGGGYQPFIFDNIVYFLEQGDWTWLK